MLLRIHHTHSLDGDTLEELREIVNGSETRLSAQLDQMFSSLTKQGEEETMDLTRLAASVKRNTDGIASAKAALVGVAQQIRDNAANQTALNALADTLEADDAGLADAIVANTAAAPPPSSSAA